MLMQKKMGLVVASVTLILTVMTFAPYLIPVAVISDGTTQSETIVETAPAPPGMLAYWELNENDGSSVHDSISPYVNGYTVNGPSWITGIAGSGLELHSTQSVNFDSATDLYAVAYLTIEAWVNLQDTSGLHTILMNSYSSKYTMYNFAIEDGHLYFDRQFDTPGNAFTSSATMTAGEWHHVAVVMDAGNKKISFYIDGTEEIISNYNDYFSGPAGLVTIGADRPIGTSSFLQGMIDEVAIYNSIVMQSVIEEHYQKGLLGLGYLDDFPPNEAPVANDDSYTMDQDTVMIVDAPGVLVNDIDADSDSLETDFVSGPSNGGLVLNPDGSFVYTPLGGFIGIDAFEYRAYDGVDYSASATVTITVEEVNHPPVAEDDAYTTDEDVPLSIASPGVLTNDYDAEPGNHITAELVTGPQHGSLTLYPEGDFNYIPDYDWNGIDTFTYRVFDGQVYGNDATVTITVNSVNDAPVATDDAYSGLEDLEMVHNILDNDLDLEGDSIEPILVSDPSHGTLEIYPDGSFTYLPDPNWFGVDSFTYKVYDGNDYSNVATVTLTIDGVNDAPVAVDDAQSGVEDLPLTFNTILTNDYDLDGDSLEAYLDTGPLYGVLVLYSNGTYTYTPDSNWFGTDSFTYYVFDGQEYSNVATVTITITGVNDAPVASDDEYIGYEDSQILADSLLYNDCDVEGDSLQVFVMTGPSHGVLTLDPLTGDFNYMPNPNWYGVDSFTYYLFDGFTDSNVATVTITIIGVNDAPVASDDTYSGVEDNELSATSILGNDYDTDEDDLQIILVSGPLHGVLDLNLDTGSFTFIPDADWFGTDSFTYRLYDDQEYSNVATVTLTISAVNDVPVASDITYYAAESSTLSIFSPEDILTRGVIDIDTAIEFLAVHLVDGPAVGTLTLNADGSFEYSVTGWSGTVTFTYRVFDGTDYSNTATVTIYNVGDDDTTGPEISIIYSGAATDGSPGTWTVIAIDPESGIDWIIVEIDGVSVGYAEGTYPVPNSLGPHTITVTAANADLDMTDDDQETSTQSQTVSIVDDDVTAPSISITYTGDLTDINPGFWTITASDLESGIYSILVEIDGVVVGSVEGDYAVPSSVGVHTLTVTVVNNDVDRPSDQESITDVVEVFIEQSISSTEIVYTGDISGVYSDPVYLEALLLDASDQSPIPGKTILFTLGTQTAYAVTNADGIASVTIILDQEEGFYELVVSFAEDDDYPGSSSSIEFVIYRECASTIYSGVTLVDISEESITLMVTVFDDVDGYWGDLTHIYVTFTFYLSSDPLTPVYATCPVRVHAIDVAGVGLATIVIPNLPEGDYIVMVSLLPEHNRYYYAPDSQTVAISIYEPERAFVKGVGTIKDANGHNGYFAFRVYYSCKGSLEGFFIYSYRDGDWIYLMRSYEILGFSTDDNHGFFEANGTYSGFNFKTFEIVCSDDRYRFRVDVFDNKRSHEKDAFQLRIFDNLGLVEYEAGFNPFGYLMNGCIVVKNYKRH